MELVVGILDGGGSTSVVANIHNCDPTRSEADIPRHRQDMPPLLQVLALSSKKCVSHNDHATNQSIKVLGDACSGFCKHRNLEMWGSAANMHAIYKVPCGLVQIKSR
jgi:hypothetical protein